jgi:phage-related tail protein
MCKLECRNTSDMTKEGNTTLLKAHIAPTTKSKDITMTEMIDKEPRRLVLNMINSLKDDLSNQINELRKSI